MFCIDRCAKRSKERR